MNHFVLKLLKVQIAIYPTSTSPRMSFRPEDCRSVSEMKYLRNSLRTPPDSCIFGDDFFPTFLCLPEETRRRICLALMEKIVVVSAALDN